jgi:hypothetical protein
MLHRTSSGRTHEQSLPGSRQKARQLRVGLPQLAAIGAWVSLLQSEGCSTLEKGCYSTPRTCNSEAPRDMSPTPGMGRRAPWRSFQ